MLTSIAILLNSSSTFDEEFLSEDMEEAQRYSSPKDIVRDKLEKRQKKDE